MSPRNPLDSTRRPDGSISPRTITDNSPKSQGQ